MGNTIYGFNSNAGSIFDFTLYSATPALTIYDSGGTDTLDCSGYSQSQTIDLTPGSFCSIGGFTHNIGIFTTTVVENAVGGSGADTITGNSADNVLTGGGSDDNIDGGVGNDTAVYSGARANYTATLLANGSIRLIDTRIASPNGTDTIQNVEFYQFLDGTPDDLAIAELVIVAAVPFDRGRECHEGRGQQRHDAVHLHGDAGRRYQRRDLGQLRGDRHRCKPGQRN